jgi:hypothetical protein
MHSIEEEARLGIIEPPGNLQNHIEDEMFHREVVKGAEI